MKFKFDFSIILGDCFRKDSVTLKINSNTFAEKNILESNSAGSANFSVVQDKKGISVKHYHMGRFTLQRINTRLPIKLEVSVNDQSLTSTLNLKKGKIILIQYCWDEHKKQIITIEQQNSPVYFF